jgi:hypothetical protein
MVIRSNKRGKRKGFKNGKKKPRRDVKTSVAEISTQFQQIGSAWSNPLSQWAKYKFIYRDSGFTGDTTAGNGLQCLQQFRGNSCFDPDYTGVGVQPYGWDQIAAIYGRYRVVSSKITVTWFVEEDYRELRVVVLPTNDETITNHEFEDLAVMPFARSKQVLRYSNGVGQNTISNSLATDKLYPILGKAMSGTHSLVGGEPGWLWYWHVYFDTVQSAEELTITFSVRIEYNVIMDRIDTLNES